MQPILIFLSFSSWSPGVLLFWSFADHFVCFLGLGCHLLTSSGMDFSKWLSSWHVSDAWQLDREKPWTMRSWTVWRASDMTDYRIEPWSFPLTGMEIRWNPTNSSVFDVRLAGLEDLPALMFAYSSPVLLYDWLSFAVEVWFLKLWYGELSRPLPPDNGVLV